MASRHACSGCCLPSACRQRLPLTHARGPALAFLSWEQVYGGDAPEEQRRAAQVWWALRVHGHPRAHLLRGAGYGAWLASRPQDTELYEPCPLKLCSVFEGELQPGLVWQPHQAPEGDAGVVLVDVDLFGEEAGEVPAGRGAGGRTVFVSRSGQNHAEACFRAARHEDAGGGPWAVAH